ncbi:MAG TPA: helix-turn-helix transcriptional regulator [Xanthobacteraceae bacterium]|nr:helix-turn-helix transcriptional regulator [Xanthobacteraceae bacterium]
MKSKKREPAQFDVDALRAALDGERIARGLTWKDVSAESGVSASTLTRLSQGKRPDVDSLTALTHWMGVSADRFMGVPQKGFGGASPLAQISSILRDDPNLNKDAATALDQLIKSTYARLRSNR